MGVRRPLGLSVDEMEAAMRFLGTTMQARTTRALIDGRRLWPPDRDSALVGEAVLERWESIGAKVAERPTGPFSPAGLR